jgi:hypothetical protein
VKRSERRADGSMVTSGGCDAFHDALTNWPQTVRDDCDDARPRGISL